MAKRQKQTEKPDCKIEKAEETEEITFEEFERTMKRIVHAKPEPKTKKEAGKG